VAPETAGILQSQFFKPAQDQEKGDAAFKFFAPPAPNEDRAAGA